MNTVPLRIQSFTYNLVYVVLWMIEMALLARFVLKLLGANPFHPLVAFVYSAATIFMGPFATIFGTIAQDGIVVEPSVLVAMVFYAVVAYLVVALLGVVTRRYPTYFS